MDDPTGLVTLAAHAAREAGLHAHRRLHDLRTGVATKSSATDMVSEVDHESEALLVRIIRENRPDDAILGEEGGERPGASGVRWVIDPLDGTTNYLYRRGDFCVPVGVERDGVTVAGAVYDPVRDEMFLATRGGGATLNGVPVRVPDAAVLSTALVGTGFGYDPDVRGRQGRVVARLLPRVRDIRRAGSAALDLCAVACGRLDAYYESGLQPWDMCAGLLVVEEAGGRIGFVDIPGERRAVVAAGPRLWDALAAAVTGRPASPPRIEPAPPELIAEVWARSWGEFMVTPERTYGPADLEGAAVYQGDDLVALVTWLWEDGGAEITSLNAFVEGRGYGSLAMDHAEETIRRAGGRHARLFTTNPNLRAIDMYLRRGYRVVRIHLDAMDHVRELKPHVPLEEDGLPLRDMWELRKDL